MNKVLQTFSALLLISVFLVGCSKAVDIQLAPELQVYLSSDRDKTFTIAKNDPAYDELNAWFKEHQSSGWYPTSGKYRGGVYMTSGEYGIQVTERRVVIYSREKAEPEAIFVQEINNYDLLVVKALAER